MAPQRQLAYFGYLAPIIALGFVTVAALADPKFSWQSRSLSSIGEATNQSLFALGSLDQIAFLLFNGGLLLGGVLGLPFMYGLWLSEGKPKQVYGYVALATTLASMAGVGIAYLDGPLDSIHLIFATLLFFSLTFTLWFFGTGRVIQGRSRYGLTWIWIANVHAIVWVVWIMLEGLVWTNDSYWTWFAVPEYVGAVLIGAWIVGQAWLIRTGKL
ncbi:MAG: putative membrane protein [Halobacteriales archaeon]|jgi:hypothetical membrane protein